MSVSVPSHLSDPCEKSVSLHESDPEVTSESEPYSDPCKKSVPFETSDPIS